MMELPTQPEWVPQWVPEPQPAPAARPRDPLAVALGNASLLGVGYAMLGRRGLAIVGALVSVALVAVLTLAVRTVWFEVIVLGWWAATIWHGWHLAGGRRQSRQGGVRRQRLIALAVTIPVLLAVGLLRFDASRIEGEVAEARRTGDCTRALDSLDSRWAGHRVANAPLAAGGDDTIRACDLLSRSAKDLNTALTGDTDALKPAFGRFATVLANLPGHEKLVQEVLDDFLDRLPTKDPCETTAITNWLRDRRAGGVLRRATATVPRIAPAAIVTCGDTLMAANSWQEARERYQQLLKQYPDHKLAAKATAGVTQATYAIELANVRSLLGTSSSGETPAYCTKPAPYSAAPPYGGGGANRALVYGDATYATQLPTLWRATDVTNAVVVICADETDYGAPVETCPYTSESGVSGAVTFHKIAIPMSVYELRTGKLLGRTQVQIGGASCPDVFYAPTYGGGPPPQEYVTPAPADVHAGFQGLIFP